MEFGSALILGGGKGSRMGFDKKNIEVEGRLLIDRTLDSLKGVFEELIVSSNTDFNRENVLVLHDSLGSGPLAGIYEALCHCKSRYLYVVACDMPCVSLDYIRFMMEKLKNQENPKDACVYKRQDDFLEPFNSFYNVSCAAKIKNALESGNYKVLPLLKSLNLHIINNEDAMQFSPNLFFNVNYKHDLSLLHKT